METPGAFRFGRFLFEPRERILFCNQARVPVSPKVLETLAILLEHKGGIVSKQEFMKRLWPETFVEESNLTQNIFTLRRVLGVTDAGLPYVETLPKRGYRIAVPIEISTPETSDASEGRHTPALSLAPVPPSSSLPVSTGPALPLQEAKGRVPPARAGSAALRRISLLARQPRALIVLALAAAGALLLVLFPRTPPRTVHGSVLETRRLTNDGVPKNLGPFPAPLVSDGERLYFTERRDNRSVLAQVPIGGGLVGSQPAPFPDATVVDYSPANHLLLLGSVWHTRDDRPILVEQPGSTAARQIGELTGHDATWSPDGQHVAFAQGRFLKVANADGSNIQTVVSATGVVYWPRWSPNGAVLRFSENFGSNESQVWEVASGGGGLHQLFLSSPDHDQVCCGNWTADGRYFFYLSGGPATNAVFAIPGKAAYNTQGLEAVKLAGEGNQLWRSPLPNADGHRLWMIGSQRRGELVRVDARLRTPAPYLGGISAEGVSFSPDKSFMAYTAYPEGTLWRSHLDGTERKQLSYSPLVARFPRWSPDGSMIAYLGGQAGSVWRIYLVNARTGETHPLLDDGSSQGVPSWSPDGTKIAFGRLLDYGTERNPNLTVEIYDRVLRSHTTLHGSQGLFSPRWSPNGRYFTAVTQNSRALRLFDTQAQQWTDLTDIGVNDVVWSEDSKSVFFDTFFGLDPGLYRLQVQTRKLERWADLRGVQRGGFFGPWLGLSPEGTPILLRDKTVEEIYQLSLDLSE